MDENGKRLVREMASYKKSQMTWESMSESIRRKMASIQKEQGKNMKERAAEAKAARKARDGKLGQIKPQSGLYRTQLTYSLPTSFIPL